MQLKVVLVVQAFKQKMVAAKHDLVAANQKVKPAISKIPLTVLDDEGEALSECDNCGLQYRSSKSTSSLRLTYCGFLCEIGDLGFSIDGLEQMEITKEENLNI